MSTRKIKDAKDLSTNELIYFKGHAQATYMSDGRTVEEAVNSMSGGSGGGSSNGSGAYSEVNHGTSDTIFTLTPNTFHVWDEVSTLTLTLGSETSGVANEFLFQFTSGATATTLTLPDDIKWANDSAPTIVENMIYQVSILKGLASVLEFSNAAQIISFTVNGNIYNAEQGMSWRQFINSAYNISYNGFMEDFSVMDTTVGYMFSSGLWGDVQLNNINVLPDSLIVENATYTAIISGGGFES